MKMREKTGAQLYSESKQWLSNKVGEFKKDGVFTKAGSLTLVEWAIVLVMILILIKGFASIKKVESKKETPVAVVAPVIKKDFSISAEFDIEHMNVFSVERNKDGITIIGYFIVGDNEPKLWYMIETDAQHESFSQRVKAKLGQR